MQSSLEDQHKMLKEIISITNNIIEDQQSIKDIAENLKHETQQLHTKHQELQEVLQRSQQQLSIQTPIPIEQINLLAKEVNEKKAEQEQQWQSLQRLLDQVHLKCNQQRSILTVNKSLQNHAKKEHVRDTTQLTNGIHIVDSSIVFADADSSLSSLSSPRENGISKESSTLSFDNLVHYSETFVPHEPEVKICENSIEGGPKWREIRGEKMKSEGFNGRGITFY